MIHVRYLALAFAAICTLGLSGCGLLQRALSVPGHLLRSGLLPVKVVENEQKPAEGVVVDREPIAEDYTENQIAISEGKSR